MAVALARSGTAPSSGPSLGSGLFRNRQCGLRVLVGQDDEHGCLFGYDAEGPAAGNAMDMGRGGVEVGGCRRDIGNCGGLGVVGWVFPALMVWKLGRLSDVPHEMACHAFESARPG